MNFLQRLVALITVAALVAVVLFLPRTAPIVGTRYPFVFGNSMALKLSVDMNMVAIEVVVVVLVGGALYFIAGRMR